MSDKFEVWWKKNWNDDCDDQMTEKDYGRAGWLAGRISMREECAEVVANLGDPYWKDGEEIADAIRRIKE